MRLNSWTLIVMNLVTLKAAAHLELLFHKPAYTKLGVLMTIEQRLMLKGKARCLYYKHITIFIS